MDNISSNYGFFKMFVQKNAGKCGLSNFKFKIFKISFMFLCVDGVYMVHFKNH